MPGYPGQATGMFRRKVSILMGIHYFQTSLTFYNVDYKVLRASTDSLSPLGNVPPPEQNTETRGTNTKTGPFVWAESGKHEIVSNKNGVMKVKG